MEKRIQKTADDVVMETVETVTHKTRHSQKELLRRRAYFESLKQKAEAGLAEVDALLTEMGYGT